MTPRTSQHPPVVTSPSRRGLDAYTAMGTSAVDQFFFTLRRSCRFVLEGHERRTKLGACIEVFWHRDALAYCSILPREIPIVALLDPSLYMLSWDVWAQRRGWEPILGGEASTFLALDGPVGPPKKMKRGRLRMALRSGRPIVPICVEYSQAIELPTWDRRRLPAPGSTVTLSFLDPLDTAEGEDRVVATLARLLE